MPGKLSEIYRKPFSILKICLKLYFFSEMGLIFLILVRLKMLKAGDRSKLFNSRWIMVLTAIVVVWVHINQERWRTNNVLVHDVLNYYSYLPAFFYEND